YAVMRSVLPATAAKAAAPARNTTPTHMRTTLHQRRFLCSMAASVTRGSAWCAQIVASAEHGATLRQNWSERTLPGEWHVALTCVKTHRGDNQLPSRKRHTARLARMTCDWYRGHRVPGKESTTEDGRRSNPRAGVMTRVASHAQTHSRNGPLVS